MKNRQRGITIIETVGALAIGTMMMLGLTALVDTSLEDLEGEQAARYQAQVTAAARDYIDQNYPDLRLATLSPGAVASVTVTDLTTAGLLPAGFSLTNAYNQRTCILVRQRQDAAGVPNGRLDALVVTSGGQPIEDRHIAMVAATAGQGGGYISTAEHEVAQGGSWTVDTTPYRGTPCEAGGDSVLQGVQAHDGGHLASHLFFDGRNDTDFLHRKGIAGRPDLTTMSTPIRMDGSAIVTAGAACDASALAVDANGRLATCLLKPDSTRAWSVANQYWKEPVATFAALSDPAVIASSHAGDVRMVMGGMNRAFVYDGAAWAALAVDQLGNFTVPENLTVTNGNLSVETGDVSVRGHITARRDITGRGVIATGYFSGPRMTLREVMNPGDTCNIETTNEDGDLTYMYPIGTVVRDSNNWLMICDVDETFHYVNGS